MQFLRDRRGTNTIEWMVVAVIIVAIVGGAIVALSDTIKTRLEAINNAL